jgi:hypothetical protein
MSNLFATYLNENGDKRLKNGWDKLSYVQFALNARKLLDAVHSRKPEHVQSTYLSFGYISSLIRRHFDGKIVMYTQKSRFSKHIGKFYVVQYDSEHAKPNFDPSDHSLSELPERAARNGNRATRRASPAVPAGAILPGTTLTQESVFPQIPTMARVTPVVPATLTASNPTLPVTMSFHSSTPEIASTESRAGTRGINTMANSLNFPNSRYNNPERIRQIQMAMGHANDERAPSVPPTSVQDTPSPLEADRDPDRPLHDFPNEIDPKQSSETGPSSPGIPPLIPANDPALLVREGPGSSTQSEMDGDINNAPTTENLDDDDAPLPSTDDTPSTSQSSLSGGELLITKRNANSNRSHLKRKDPIHVDNDQPVRKIPKTKTQSCRQSSEGGNTINLYDDTSSSDDSIIGESSRLASAKGWEKNLDLSAITTGQTPSANQKRISVPSQVTTISTPMSKIGYITRKFPYGIDLPLFENFILHEMKTILGSMTASDVRAYVWDSILSNREPLEVPMFQLASSLLKPPRAKPAPGTRTTPCQIQSRVISVEGEERHQRFFVGILTALSNQYPFRFGRFWKHSEMTDSPSVLRGALLDHNRFVRSVSMLKLTHFPKEWMFSEVRTEQLPPNLLSKLPVHQNVEWAPGSTVASMLMQMKANEPFLDHTDPPIILNLENTSDDTWIVLCHFEHWLSLYNWLTMDFKNLVHACEYSIRRGKNSPTVWKEDRCWKYKDDIQRECLPHDTTGYAQRYLDIPRTVPARCRDIATDDTNEGGVSIADTNSSEQRTVMSASNGDGCNSTSGNSPANDEIIPDLEEPPDEGNEANDDCGHGLASVSQNLAGQFTSPTSSDLVGNSSHNCRRSVPPVPSFHPNESNSSVQSELSKSRSSVRSVGPVSSQRSNCHDSRSGSQDISYQSSVGSSLNDFSQLRTQPSSRNNGPGHSARRGPVRADDFSLASSSRASTSASIAVSSRRRNSRTDNLSLPSSSRAGTLAPMTATIGLDEDVDPSTPLDYSQLDSLRHYRHPRPPLGGIDGADWLQSVGIEVDNSYHCDGFDNASEDGFPQPHIYAMSKHADIKKRPNFHLFLSQKDGGTNPLDAIYMRLFVCKLLKLSKSWNEDAFIRDTYMNKEKKKERHQFVTSIGKQEVFSLMSVLAFLQLLLVSELCR